MSGFGDPSATWDGRVVQELRSLSEPDGPDFVGELLAAFRDEAVLCFGRIDDALSRGDAAEAGRAAHKLKGGALNLGANRLARTAAELERTAKAGDPAPLGALAAALRVEWERFAARAAPASTDR